MYLVIIGVKMIEYLNRIIDFCNSYPSWSVAFFVCGFIIGEVYL